MYRSSKLGGEACEKLSTIMEMHRGVNVCSQIKHRSSLGRVEKSLDSVPAGIAICAIERFGSVETKRFIEVVSEELVGLRDDAVMECWYTKAQG